MTITMTLKQAQEVISAHREAEYAAKAEKARTYIGRFFKYRNSYGSGDKWWLYGMVTAATDYGAPTGVTFQRPSDNRLEVRLEDQIAVDHGGWIEIDSAEFWKHAAETRNELIAHLTPPEVDARGRLTHD